MEELYGISRVLFRHHEYVETKILNEKSDEKSDSEFYGLYPPEQAGDGHFNENIIDTHKFKELLLSMPSADYIDNFHESFKISKDHNSIRISIFWFYKRTQVIRGKHQLEKQLKVTRYIIKRGKNNFCNFYNRNWKNS